MKPSSLRCDTSEAVLEIAESVWTQREAFICWPERELLLMSGTVRESYHKYPADVRAKLEAAKVPVDTRSNGPAISAFKLAGGERPKRHGGRREWSVHHIYDGKFPAPGRTTTTHAVKDGRYFTHSGGLVAVHPIADALADEVPYFAWLLRAEAFRRFKFDPDNVFNGTDDIDPLGRRVG